MTWRSSAGSLAQRDVPLWARGVSAVLIIFASWWFFNSEGIRAVVGESVAALCLGVIAVSILQGMRLPLAVWPDGPWRRTFATPYVVVTGAAVAFLILISGARFSSILSAQIDLGTGITAVVGTVALGYGFALVRQRGYLKWYGIAFGLALLPTIVNAVVGIGEPSEAGTGLCLLTVPDSQDLAESTRACSVALLPSLGLLTAIGVGAKLVTEELAFRRLLIGSSPGAGLLTVLASSAIAFGWYVVIFTAGAGESGTMVIGTIGAISAGSIYVMSKSLPASAIFTATYTAGYTTLTLAGGDSLSASFWIAASCVTVALLVVLTRRHGVFGNLKETSSRHVTRS